MPPAAREVHVRILDGPNHYFPRPAVVLTIAPLGLLSLGEADARRLASRLRLAEPVRPGEPGSDQRILFAARCLARLLRGLAYRSGSERLAVRSRPHLPTSTVALAFPWRRERRAEALARATGALATALVDRAAIDALPDRIAALAAEVRSTPDGPPPATPVPRVPTVGVTGTNGKTTVTRLVARMAAEAGHVPGWCTSDGVWIGGRLVDEGDLTGYVGSRTVIESDEVTFAVLETARGGILRRGIGATHNDVSVVTNISADHLGLGGVDTLEQLAEVKAAVVRITRPGGVAVLNADDQRVLAMRRYTKAAIWAFGLDPFGPGIREVLDAGGRAVTVLDGHIALLGRRGDPVRVIAIDDVPITISGAARHNVLNALAATAAGVAAGLPLEAVCAGLHGFRPDPAENPGRLNVFCRDERIVIVDYGHNAEGLEALLAVAEAMRRPGGSLRLLLNGVGDRTDEMLVTMGELGGKTADDVVIAERDSALRGRTREELFGLLRAGLANVGRPEIEGRPSEIEALETLIGRMAPGDVCAAMIHDERDDVFAKLEADGWTVADPTALVAAARR